jgi:hypothetical protein
MKNASLALALLIAALGAGGCSYYFRVTDTTNGRVYYTKDYAREPNNVRFKDAMTGKEMTLPVADVRSISSEEYEANVKK